MEAKASWKQDQVSYYDVKTNSLGLIDKETRAVPLKKTGKRIMFIGDSFIEGVGSPWNETVAGIISNKLEKLNIELLNGAVISYSPKLYWLKTKYLLELGLEIDELFVFIDISDIIDEVVYDYFIPKEISEFEKLFQPVIDFFIKHSFFYRSYRVRYYLNQINPYSERSEYWGGLEEFYGLKPKWTYDYEAMNLYGRKGIELAVKNMDNLIKMCRQKNIKTHIIVWPWLDHAKNKNGRKHLYLWNHYAKKNNINFIQMFDFFESMENDKLESLFIPKDIHWNSLGNKEVANYIWEQISPFFTEN